MRRCICKGINMPLTCSFLFHQRLNDFLPTGQRLRRLPFSCSTRTTVKDAIEAIGIPHVEVEKITVNGEARPFNYLLSQDDEVNVYPYTEESAGPHPDKFILDVHLGKLARLLRMLGIDTCYRNNFADKEIVQLAVQEKRAVLTRDIGLLKHKVLAQGYWLRSQDANEQLLEVIRRFSLCDRIQPFTRCLACNGHLKPVAKAEVSHLLLPQTQEAFNEFYQCSHCQHTFWKGSHYEKMEKKIQQIRLLACQ